MNFERCFEIVVGVEGVYSGDPQDRGNWTGGKVGEGELRGTKYGISAAAYPSLDIPRLTLNQAKAIYFEDYWTPVRASELPPDLQLPVFDMAVNQGKAAAANTLQRAARVTVDGKIGPITIKAAWDNEVATWKRFMAKRMRRYGDDPKWTTYGDGWSNRLMEIAYTALRGK